MQRLLGKIVLALCIVLVVIQFIPVSRTNPPVTADIPTSPAVKTVLRRACYDCHSNETVYPWYSHIAPVSWLLAHDVSEGREELNFSTWNQYSAKDQGEKTHEIREAIVEGEMPPWYYTLIHREAVLSSEDRRVLQSWAGKFARSERPDDDRDNDEKHNAR